jgi:hypothetical protein
MKQLPAIALLAVLAIAPPTAATEVHWTPAHDLAPQGQSAGFAAADLDGDIDVDISMLSLNPARQYWNVGTPQNPDWQLDVSQFGEIPYCAYRAAAFGDVDADGDLDAVITCGTSDDEPPWFFRNTGTPQAPAWEADPTVVEGLAVPGGGAEPYLADLDADGDLDLLVAISSGWVKHFENAGTPDAPLWEQVGYLDGVTIGPGARPTIAFGDVDGDEDLDLVGVTWDTPPQSWENVGTPSAYEFVENPLMLIGVDQPGDTGSFGIDLLDIDADGDLDMMIAAYLLGNLLYLNEGFTPVGRTSWGMLKGLWREPPN